MGLDVGLVADGVAATCVQNSKLRLDFRMTHIVDARRVSWRAESEEGNWTKGNKNIL